MNLTLNRPEQARLDMIEGLMAFVAGQLVPGVRKDYETWVESEKPAQEQLRNRNYMNARFFRDARYQASRGLQRLSQEASYDSLDPLSACLMDWDTRHNGEPYWRSYHELDLLKVYEEAGLAAELIEACSEWGGAKGNYMGKFSYHVTSGVKPG